MNRSIVVRAGVGALAAVGMVALAVARPLPPVGLVVCFALLLGALLFAVAWTGLEELSVEAAQITRARRERTAAAIEEASAARRRARTSTPTQPRQSEPRPSAIGPEQQWTRATEHHDAVLSAYGAYELDPAMLLKYPAMWDLSASEVMDFHDALDLAGSLRTAQYSDARVCHDYVDAVGLLRGAWHTADRYARSTGTDGLGEDDARDCRRAAKLLDHAHSASGAERAAYLQQVVAIVDRLTDRGVVARAPKIAAVLESQVRYALES